MIATITVSDDRKITIEGTRTGFDVRYFKVDELSAIYNEHWRESFPTLDLAWAFAEGLKVEF